MNVQAADRNEAGPAIGVHTAIIPTEVRVLVHFPVNVIEDVLAAQRAVIEGAGDLRTRQFSRKGTTMNITAYERTWVEGLNRGDVSAADRAFAPDCVIHINGSPEPNLSLAGFKEMVSGLLGAFRDLHFTIEDQIVAGDKVATRWTAEGTNSGAFGSVPATGRHIQISGLILDRVVDGKVVERWEQWDQMAMLQQLGLAQA